MATFVNHILKQRCTKTRPLFTHRLKKEEVISIETSLDEEQKKKLEPVIQDLKELEVKILSVRETMTINELQELETSMDGPTHDLHIPYCRVLDQKHGRLLGNYELDKVDEKLQEFQNSLKSWKPRCLNYSELKKAHQ